MLLVLLPRTDEQQSRSGGASVTSGCMFLTVCMFSGSPESEAVIVPSALYLVFTLVGLFLNKGRSAKSSKHPYKLG